MDIDKTIRNLEIKNLLDSVASAEPIKSDRQAGELLCSLSKQSSLDELTFFSYFLQASEITEIHVNYNVFRPTTKNRMEKCLVYEFKVDAGAFEDKDKLAEIFKESLGWIGRQDPTVESLLSMDGKIRFLSLKVVSPFDIATTLIDLHKDIGWERLPSQKALQTPFMRMIRATTGELK